MKPDRLLQQIDRGQAQNVRFRDLRRLLDALGFEQVRVRGSHHIFHHPEVDELMNVQNVHGQVKPYQVRQVVGLVRRYDLGLEDDL